MYVYNISSVINIHHITHNKKFNKLLQGTHILKELPKPKPWPKLTIKLKYLGNKGHHYQLSPKQVSVYKEILKQPKIKMLVRQMQKQYNCQEMLYEGVKLQVLFAKKKMQFVKNCNKRKRNVKNCNKRVC